jgi:hypothetical protein
MWERQHTQLLLPSLSYAFVLSLLALDNASLRHWLLRSWCPRMPLENRLRLFLPSFVSSISMSLRMSPIVDAPEQVPRLASVHRALPIPVQGALGQVVERHAIGSWLTVK